MTGFFSSLRNTFSSKKKVRQVGMVAKQSELENCLGQSVPMESIRIPEESLEYDQSVGGQLSLQEIIDTKKSPDSSSVPPKHHHEESKEIPKFSVKSSQANSIVKFAREWSFIEATDDYRVPYAAKKGGLPLTDKEVLKKLRDAGKEIIKAIGKKILRGDFNLTTISFPIKCMEPRSVLHNTIRSMLMDPLYLNRAALIKDPVERLRLVMIARISGFIHTSQFLKPMNPILGETISATGPDGALYYAEQSCHHPPVTHFLVYGPQNRYTCSGYYIFEAKAGLNSLKIVNTGKRRVTFEDGQTITLNCPDESFCNTFIGTVRHENLSPMFFVDEANNLEGQVTFGTVKNKPSDYLDGVIIQNRTQLISRLSGTYLGWLDFDGRRYWDARYVSPYQVNYDGILPSDSEFRSDLLLLREGDMEGAQVAKERLEMLQREDRALRTKFNKRKQH